MLTSKVERKSLPLIALPKARSPEPIGDAQLVPQMPISARWHCIQTYENASTRLVQRTVKWVFQWRWYLWTQNSPFILINHKPSRTKTGARNTVGCYVYIVVLLERLWRVQYNAFYSVCRFLSTLGYLIASEERLLLDLVARSVCLWVVAQYRRSLFLSMYETCRRVSLSLLLSLPWKRGSFLNCVWLKGYTIVLNWEFGCML